jgi:hypothetical protein
VKYKYLAQQVEALRPELAPPLVEQAVYTLLREGEDVGGGINAIRLIKRLLGAPQLRDVEATWAYDHLKPALRVALAQIPSLYYFEGD